MEGTKAGHGPQAARGVQPLKRLAGDEGRRTQRRLSTGESIRHWTDAMGQMGQCIMGRSRILALERVIGAASGPEATQPLERSKGPDAATRQDSIVVVVAA